MLIDYSIVYTRRFTLQERQQLVLLVCFKVKYKSTKSNIACMNSHP